MTDLFIAGNYSRERIQDALRIATGYQDIVVVSKIENCLELSEHTNWVTLYSDYNHRFPIYISSDGMEFPMSALSALASTLNCEIAFELYTSPNPYVYSLISVAGKITTFEFSEEDIEPSGG